eukprot:SAG31_NODE_31690_length_365_cov_0.823308_1_plen_63_part_01
MRWLWLPLCWVHGCWGSLLAVWLGTRTNRTSEPHTGSDVFLKKVSAVTANAPFAIADDMAQCN